MLFGLSLPRTALLNLGCLNTTTCPDCVFVELWVLLEQLKSDLDQRSAYQFFENESEPDRLCHNLAGQDLPILALY